MDQTPTSDIVLFLRACADAVERGDLGPYDVAQALFHHDGYTIDCPISEAAGTCRPAHRPSAVLLDELEAMASSIKSSVRP